MPSSKKVRQVPDTVIRVGRQGAIYQQQETRQVERVQGTTEEGSEEHEVIVDRSAAEIIDQINKRVKSPYYSLYWGIATLLSVPLIIPPVILAFVTYKAYRDDIRRKTTPLLYEFSDSYSEKKFQEGIEAFSNLATTHSSWRLKSQVAVNDWKRNAGSSAALVRQRAKLGKLKPNLIRTNVEVWGVEAGSIKLYLLPDRFFVFQDGVYSAIPYSEIQTSLQDLEYVEQEALPRDAKVVGKTWKYVRRDGGADRRFNNNRQLPIARYGLVAFSSQNFIAYLIVSSLEVASSFTHSFSRILSSANIQPQPLQSSSDQFQAFLADSNDLPEHLETLEKASMQGSVLTTTQIAQLLGISNSAITKNPDNFEYEGFRFIRAGRVGRQISWQVEKL
jgi:hypothetical protein